MTSVRTRFALGVVAITIFACAEPRKEPGKEPEARFGVFFGGQVQERREIPFELDRGKLALGFRIEFPAPLTEDVRIEWRITPPPPSGKPRTASAAAASAAAATADPRAASSDVVRAGETRFERTTPLRAGDPLGMWNARVVAGGKVLVDRPFEVFDPALRARAIKADGGF